jgi:hypothetical protein
MSRISQSVGVRILTPLQLQTFVEGKPSDVFGATTNDCIDERNHDHPTLDATLCQTLDHDHGIYVKVL